MVDTVTIKTNETNTHTLKPYLTGKVNAAVELYYETFGSEKNPAIILIMGVGQQCVAWPDTFCQQLVEQGFYVVRFDNRDIGLSGDANAQIKPNLMQDFVRYKLGFTIKSNYLLYDMAADVIGLMDGLGIQKAHIVGMSMGGMIAQLVAALYPARVLSLNVLMSTTNHPNLPQPKMPVTLRMAGFGVKRSRDPNIIIDESFKTLKLLRGNRYQTSDDVLKQRITRSVQRRYHPVGYIRQANAILATGSFEHVLGRVQAPTLVVHGSDDPLLRLACGQRVADCIKHSKLEIIDGLGHEFPCEINTVLTDLITNNAS